MRFGVCCSLDKASKVIEAGFDYVELPAGTWFGQVEEPDWDALDGVPVETTNLFIHGDLKIVGPDKGDIRGYAERMIPRAAKAGVQVMVFGSGGARRSPAGYDLDTAEDDFLSAVQICSDIGARYGVTIAPEALRREETNVGNYLGDLARIMGYRKLSFTADCYHALHQPGAQADQADFWEGELPFAPAHVHLASKDRTWKLAEAPEILGFMNRLKTLGYDERMSFECHWEDFESELPEAREQVQQLWNSIS